MTRPIPPGCCRGSRCESLITECGRAYALRLRLLGRLRRLKVRRGFVEVDPIALLQAALRLFEILLAHTLRIGLPEQTIAVFIVTAGDK